MYLLARSHGPAEAKGLHLEPCGLDAQEKFAGFDALTIGQLQALKNVARSIQRHRQLV